jgi:hypothetical protein
MREALNQSFNALRGRPIPRPDSVVKPQHIRTLCFVTLAIQDITSNIRHMRTFLP